MTLLAHYESPLGELTLAGEDGSLTGLWFAGQRHFGSTLLGGEVEGELPVFGEVRRWLDAYFAGRVPAWTPQLELRGTEFRKAVWRALLEIPYGETLTYGELARRVAGARGGDGAKLARAVGGAVGRNPLTLIVPCHRVVGAVGSLTGYAGGLDRKRWLLGLERLVLGESGQATR